MSLHRELLHPSCKKIKIAFDKPRRICKDLTRLFTQGENVKRLREESKIKKESENVLY